MATESSTAPMSDAKRSAFEKCRLARAAALQRKKEAAAAAKEAKNAPAPVPEPIAEPAPQPTPEPPAAPEPVAAPEPPAPVPPTPAPTPLAADEEEEAFEVMDPAELMALLNKQQEMISSLHEDVKGIRAHQADLSHSFTAAGVKQAYSLNFV